MTVKISIVIPFCNPPKDRFKSCLESIAQQGYRNYEVICVDDGSDESYAKLIEGCTANFPTKVIQIRQENEGVSIARNNGTLQASGDYVLYVDSDDELPPYMLERAVQVIERQSPQVILGFVQYIRSNRDKKVVDSGRSVTYSAGKVAKLFDYHLSGIPSGICAKLENGAVLKIGPVARLVESKLAKETPFPRNVPVSEDTLWNLLIFDKAKDVVIVEDVWYWYWVSHQSASRGYRRRARDDAEKFTEALNETLKATRHKPDDSLVCARILGEIDRAVRMYYAKKECPLSLSEKMREIRELFRKNAMSHCLRLRYAKQLGWSMAAKYLLCKTSLVLFYFFLLEARNER